MEKAPRIQDVRKHLRSLKRKKRHQYGGAGKAVAAGSSWPRDRLASCGLLG